MKALIFGATGLVGHSLWRDWKSRGWDITGTYLHRPLPGLVKCDVLVPGEAEKLIDSAQPKVVVLTASNPFVDYCEMHSVETRKINVDATLRITEAAKRIRAKLVFFSTDYVFDGEKGRSYTEQDQLRPHNEYGRQKVMAEAGIQRILANHLILRISGVYGWEFKPKNFVLQLLETIPNKNMKVAGDLTYNPTYAPDIAAAAADLLDRDAKGIFHVAGSETITRYDFARLAAQVFGLDASRIQSAKAIDLSQTPRPRCSALDTSKLMGLIQSPPLSASRGLEAMKDASEEWKSYAGSLTAA